jgi:hypothetical protein
MDEPVHSLPQPRLPSVAATASPKPSTEPSGETWASRAMLPCFGVLDFVAKQRRHDATKSKITRAVTIGQSEEGIWHRRGEDARLVQTELEP